MSADRPGREVAYRLFAAEYDDASYSHTESDEERAPNYVITPTGARVNRLFVVGTLTEVTQVNDEMLRARVVDPTGAFVVYAGQYQPDELAALERLEPPAFVAVTGKARTFQPEDSDRVYTSVRPESIATVDAETRDRWVVATAEQTRERIETYAAAAELDAAGDDLAAALRDADVPNGLASGIPLAQAHYGTTPAYLEALCDLSTEAARVVAGDLDQVGGLALEPGDAGATTASFESLATTALEAQSAGGAADEPETEPAAETATESTGESADAAVETEVASASGGAETEEVVDETVDAAPGENGTDAAATAEDATADADALEATTNGEESTSFDEDELAVDDGDDLGDFESTASSGEMYEMDDEEREELEAEFGAEFTTGSEVDDPGNADIDVPSSDESANADADETVGAESEAEPADDEPDVGEVESDAAEPADETDDVAEPVADEAKSSDETDAETDAESTVEPDDDPAETEVDEPTADPTDGAEPADDAADAAADEDVDLQDRVVETMSELDDGAGADRQTVIETVADDTGAAPADVEAAIEEALMGGQCYEPDDETLKAI